MFFILYLTLKNRYPHFQLMTIQNLWTATTIFVFVYIFICSRIFQIPIKDTRFLFLLEPVKKA